MPFSEITFDQKIIHFLKESNGATFLDIGTGAGKYGKFIRELFPSAKLDGVEIEKDYILMYNLDAIYDIIHVIDATTIADTFTDNIYDVCILGDCIEHLKKSDGIDLIEFLIYRTKYIVIVFPSEYIQYTWKGYKNEAHRSVWGSNDFINYAHEFMKEGFMNCVIIKGFLK